MYLPSEVTYHTEPSDPAVLPLTLITVPEAYVPVELPPGTEQYGTLLESVNLAKP